MNYNWYVIANLDAFIEEDLVSMSLNVQFPVLGKKTILLTSGNCYSLLIDDVLLPISLNEKNPFEFEGKAVYLDENNDIWLGLTP